MTNVISRAIYSPDMLICDRRPVSCFKCGHVFAADEAQYDPVPCPTCGAMNNLPNYEVARDADGCEFLAEPSDVRVGDENDG